MSIKKAAVVLAAGKGKRMKSDIPKVLHRIGGMPMITIIINTLIELKFDKIIIVIGHEGEQIEKELADYPVEFVWQREQLGTGHAVMMAKESLKDFDGVTLIALGDVPFLSKESINLLFDVYNRTKSKSTCLSAILDDPTGYGRIVRESDTEFLKEIVEHKDADESVLIINEINSGTFCYDNQTMFQMLDLIGNDNSQGEYYLTDTIKLLHDKGMRVSVVPAEDPDELRGVNSIDQLDELAKLFPDRIK